MTHNQEEKQLIKTNTEMTQMLEQVHMDFKRGIRNLFKNLKKNVVLMSEWRRNASRKIESIKKKNGNSLNEKKMPVIKKFTRLVYKQI